MSGGLKKDAVKGVGWSAVERFSVQGVNFLVQIILARLLFPEDYGVIGMLAIFIQIAQALIDSGFASALIQKKDCTEKDYSTVFVFSLFLSIVIYLILFLSAPWVASFYDMPILESVTRVIAISLIFECLPVIPRTILIKNLDFKTQSKASFLSASMSGIIGILMAYYGFGVWALCAQQIFYHLFQTVILFYHVRWIPVESFCRESFDRLFGFGSKLLVSSLINAVYRNIYTLVIGKAFSVDKLGCYTRAEQFAQFPSSNLANIVVRVAYPVFSRIQDDTDKLRDAYRRIIRYSSLVIFPLMFCMIAVAGPFIDLILTDKWAQVVILLQVLCLDWSLDHITALNLNLLYVKGRSDLALRLEFIKKSIALIILFSSIQFGVEGMCWGRVLYSVIATIINTHYSRKLISLSFWNQMKDFSPYLLISAIMCILVMLMCTLFESSSIKLIMGIIVGITLYIGLLFVFRRRDMRGLILLIKNR